MRVDIFYMDNCPYCTELKERLDKFNIPYNEVDINLEENEETFKMLCDLSNCESVPMVTVGKHLLAPDVNFSTIKQASELVKYIIENESD